MIFSFAKVTSKAVEALKQVDQNDRERERERERGKEDAAARGDIS